MRVTLKSLTGVAICSGTAVLLTFFLRDNSTFRLAAPVVCLQAVIVTALCWGRIPALIGTVIAGLTFAIWLFPPYGSPRIHDPLELTILFFFLLTAFGVTQVSPPSIHRG